MLEPTPRRSDPALPIADLNLPGKLLTRETAPEIPLDIADFIADQARVVAFLTAFHAFVMEVFMPFTALETTLLAPLIALEIPDLIAANTRSVVAFI